MRSNIICIYRVIYIIQSVSSLRKCICIMYNAMILVEKYISMCFAVYHLMPRKSVPHPRVCTRVRLRDVKSTVGSVSVLHMHVS
jgi:hypothetical protein